MDDLNSEWQRKGGTLSDKTARKEFGLSQEEIEQAIRAGKLQYRYNSIYGNPFLRLLRREVESLATACRVIQALVRSVFGGPRTYIARSCVLCVLLAYPVGTLSVS